VAGLGDIEATDDPAIAKRIEAELCASLSQINRQTLNLHKTFCRRDRHGEIIAGLTCSTAYGWLHIEALWVAVDRRGQGFGRQLMVTAEAFGRENGCHGAWLDTSNADAFAFYRRLRYDVFGELTNSEGQFPAEHHRWFLKRAL
jgi:ribosomal protein S18 acetylase RimI-like enzyme